MIKTCFKSCLPPKKSQNRRIPPPLSIDLSMHDATPIPFRDTRASREIHTNVKNTYVPPNPTTPNSPPPPTAASAPPTYTRKRPGLTIGNLPDHTRGHETTDEAAKRLSKEKEWLKTLYRSI